MGLCLTKLHELDPSRAHNLSAAAGPRAPTQTAAAAGAIASAHGHTMTSPLSSAEAQEDSKGKYEQHGVAQAVAVPHDVLISPHAYGFATWHSSFEAVFPDFAKLVREKFPGAGTKRGFLRLSKNLLGERGFSKQNTIACVGLCRDEICRGFRSAIHEMWGNSFNFQSRKHTFLFLPLCTPERGSVLSQGS